MRALIKYHRCKRRQNPLLRMWGWHCWRCRRANQWRACPQCSADVDTCDCERGHAPWFARLRARIFGRAKSAEFGSSREGS